MSRRIAMAGTLSAALIAVGGGAAIAAPAPLATSWTPSPVKGFAGRLGAAQPKVDSSLDGVATAAWFGGLPDEFMAPGNVLVSTYNGSSWSCPIQVPGTFPPIDSTPPAFDVGEDGTVAIAANYYNPTPFVASSKPQDAWISVRRPGEALFTGAGTGQGYLPDDEVTVATSAVRTVAAWISGSSLIGAEFLPGATSAIPQVLATGDELGFQKVRMDAAGNAAVVYRSVASGSLAQNWLIWPTGGAPSAAQAFDIESPDDFLELGAFQVSPNGRMIVAATDNRYPTERDPAVRLFMGTTTTGFTSSSVVESGDPFPNGAAVAGLSTDGTHATVGFRLDPQESSVAVGRLYAVDPISGAVLSSGSWTQPLDYGVDFFKILQDGETAYVAWTDSNLNVQKGGVLSFASGTVTEQMSAVNSDWVGLFRTSTGPHAYWPGRDAVFTPTVPHKPLNAKPTNTTVTVKRSGAITVKGKVTPATAAAACAGSSVAVWVSNLDKYNHAGAMGEATVAANGSYTWTLRRSALKGCARAKVTTYLQTPDAVKPVSATATVPCSR